MASSGFDTCLPCGAIRKEGDTICRKCGFIDKTERRRIIDFLRAKVAPFIIFCTQMIYQLEKYHYEDKNSEKEILKVMDTFELAREGLHKDLRAAFVLIEPHFGSVWDLASEFEKYLKYFQECYKTIQEAKEQSDSRRAFAAHDTPFPYYYFLESLELSFFENFKDFLNRHFSTESLLLVTAWWKTAKDLPKQAMNFDSQHASIVTPQPAAAAVALRPRKQYFLDSVEGQLAKMEKAADEERKAKDDDEDTGEEEYDYEEEEGEGWPYSRGPVKLRL